MARAATLRKMFFDHKICFWHRSLLIAFEDHHLCQLASCNLANCLLFHHARFHCSLLHAALHGAFHHWLLHRKGHCESKTKHEAVGSEAKCKSLQEDLNQFSKNTMIATKQPAQMFFANLIWSSSPMQFKSEWKTYRDSKVCPLSLMWHVFKYPTPRTFQFFYCRSLTTASLVVAQLKLLYMLSSICRKRRSKRQIWFSVNYHASSNCLKLNFSSVGIDGLGLCIECLSLSRGSINRAEALDAQLLACLDHTWAKLRSPAKGYSRLHLSL